MQRWILDQKMLKRPKPSAHLKWQESEERRREESRQNSALPEENEKSKDSFDDITEERINHTIVLKKCKRLKIESAAQKVEIRRGEGKLEAARDYNKQDLKEVRKLRKIVQERRQQYRGSLEMKKRLKSRNDVLQAKKQKLERERDFYKGKVEASRASASKAWKEKEDLEEIVTRSADQIAWIERAEDAFNLVVRLQGLRMEVMKICGLNSTAHHARLRGFPLTIERDEEVTKMLNEREGMKHYMGILKVDLIEIAEEVRIGDQKVLEAWARVEARICRLKEDIMGAVL